MSAFISAVTSAGRAGALSRVQDQPSAIEPARLSPTKAPSFFGQALKYNGVSKVFEKFEAGDTVEKFQGILIEKVSQEPVTANDYTTPNPSTTHSIVIGTAYLFVKCNVGTPVRGGLVYLRPATNVFEATADGVNNFVVPNLRWAVDGKDSNSIAEIRIA